MFQHGGGGGESTGVLVKNPPAGEDSTPTTPFLPPLTASEKSGVPTSGGSSERSFLVPRGSKGEEEPKTVPVLLVSDQQITDEQQTQEQITEEMRIAVSSLERYTGSKVDQFQPYVLITNFPDYISIFAREFGGEPTRGSSWACAHAPTEKCSIVNYNMGSPNAALVMDVIARIPKFKAVLFVGMVGGLPTEITQNCAIGKLLEKVYSAALVSPVRYVFVVLFPIPGGTGAIILTCVQHHGTPHGEKSYHDAGRK